MSTPDQTPPSPSSSPAPMQPQPAPPSPQPQAPYPPYAGYPPPPPPYASGPAASYPAYPQAPYGQPPYPQAAYPQLPYGPGYPYPQAPYPPAPPRQGSGKTVGIIIGVIAGVVILACVAGSILVVSLVRQVGNFVAPYTAATEFCLDEEQQDYVGAYQLLSSGAQQRYSQQEFVTFSENRDSNSGKVTSCTVESTGQQITATTATLTVTLQLSDGQHTGQLMLVKEGSNWLVDSADPSLQLL